MRSLARSHHAVVPHFSIEIPYALGRPIILSHELVKLDSNSPALQKLGQCMFHKTNLLPFFVRADLPSIPCAHF